MNKEEDIGLLTSNSNASPFDLVIFGGLGDLSQRKLIPALYHLDHDGRLASGNLFLVGRRPLSDQDVHKKIKLLLQDNIPDQETSDFLVDFERFIARFRYVQLDLNEEKDFLRLSAAMDCQQAHRIFYFATGSSLYKAICSGLRRAKIITTESKVVLEKPIGHDYQSAASINQAVAEYFEEKQIYRIDHYLGKETVQNLLALRFANSIFESLWSHKYIDHIQISIAESLGVEKRAGFYDKVGAMRDMLQNHLLQLLCITAMEPPSQLTADAVRDEKVKVLRALKPILGDLINEHIVRGQYDAGLTNGLPVPRYLDEENVAKSSITETFTAAKVEIENWRWAGVPFYLRTGKRLAQRSCEIIVQFKEVPHSIFPLQKKETLANQLVFRLQPDEGIRLYLNEKRLGPGMQIQSTNLSLNPDAQSSGRVPEAYERLLADVILGNATLFLRDDELLEAWRWLDPILQDSTTSKEAPENYVAGSWGPVSAILLLQKDGRHWYNS